MTTHIRFSGLLVAAAAGGLWLSAAQSVAAHPMTSGGQPSATDSVYEELRTFAREVGLGGTPAAPSSASRDDAYSALLDFARMVSADTPKTVAAEAPATSAPAKPAAAKSAKPAKPAIKENKGGEGDAYYAGSAKCMTCHAAIAADFAATLMGRIGRTTRKGAFECENCHGPGSKHVAAGGGQNTGMIAYRPTDPRYNKEEINNTCLTCHEKGGRTAWRGSTHETRGLACTSCHTVMRNVSPKNLLSSAAEAEVCFQCHKERRAQMYRTSHMPLREGKMSCSDCHNPHGSVYGTEAMLRETSINENCYKCHAEKRGPFLFEHLPVRENCDNCHAPHGSVYEAMLKAPRPRLCTECHGFDHGPGIFQNGPTSRLVFSRSCQNCHTQVHGSNSPSGAFMHR